MNFLKLNLYCNVLYRINHPIYVVKRNSYLWTSDIIRSSFISYYKNKDHIIIPSSPVVPWNDQSLEFVNAGMNQFKSTLLGTNPRPALRAANSQKCIRVGGKHNDLSIVGKDTYHHTFFEMLGNWSFNDYFKEEACKMSWEILTNIFNIPTQHLYVTYFGGDQSMGLEADEEVKQIWLSLGVPQDRILPFGSKDNFWEMGDTGPCGPCTEIHFERQPSSNGASKVNMGFEDLIEIWNIVFIQHQRMEDGQLIPLKSHYVDTGMGLERITACLNEKISNYDTDLFMPLFEAVCKMSGKRPYGGEFNLDGSCLDTSYRILADHSRMVAFTLADGLLPHDCFSLRKAISRSILIGWDVFGLSSTKNFMSNLIEIITKNLGHVYPELERNFEQSKLLLEYEEQRLIEARSQLSLDWHKLVEKHPQLRSMTNTSSKIVEALEFILPNIDKWNSDFPLEEAKTLSQKYFLSHEIIEEIVDSLGFQLDINSLKVYMQNNSDNNIPSSEVSPYAQLKFLSNILTHNNIKITDNSSKYKYDFTEKGYSYSDHKSNIKCILLDGKVVKEMKEGQSGIIVLSSSNFYPKSGGQVSDNGTILGGDNLFKVARVDTFNGYVFHYGEVQKGVMEIEKEVFLKINKNLRMGASKSHTAHHLFMGAIKHVSGMGFQRSSKVNDKGFSLDVFVHPPLQLQQLLEAEDIVRKWISLKKPVSCETMTIFEALRTEHPSLVSGEKYPDDVHVISTKFEKQEESNHKTYISSVELCCGTHLVNTGHLEHFAVTEYKKVGNGVSKISAIHGKAALKLIQNGEKLTKDFNSFSERISTAVKNNERLHELNNEFKKWKRTVAKSRLPITVFETIEERGNFLIKEMEGKLIQNSNWEELRKEFNEYLSNHPDGPVIYNMKTDYRGPLEHLLRIIDGVSGRPVVFACKGWGKVRACIYVPQEFDQNNMALKNMVQGLQQKFPGASTKVLSAETATFHLLGVKVDKIDIVRRDILDTCSKYMS